MGNKYSIFDAIENNNKITEVDNIELRDTKGNTPLLLAASYGRLTTVEILLDKNANIEATNKNGDTPLICAVINNHYKIVELLLDRKACIEVVNNSKNNALCYVALKGNVNFVDLILRYSTNVKCKSDYCNRAIELAINNTKIIAKLLNFVEPLIAYVPELLKKITCPICLNYERKIVFNCGHSTCNDCSDKLKICPECRVEISNRIKFYF